MWSQEIRRRALHMRRRRSFHLSSKLFTIPNILYSNWWRTRRGFQIDATATGLGNHIGYRFSKINSKTHHRWHWIHFKYFTKWEWYHGYYWNRNKHLSTQKPCWIFGQNKKCCQQQYTRGFIRLYFHKNLSVYKKKSWLHTTSFELCWSIHLQIWLHTRLVF